MSHYIYIRGRTLQKFKIDAMILLGRADDKIKSKLITDFMKMNKIENLKSIRHTELVSKLQTFNDYIKNVLVDEIGYFLLCFDDAPKTKITKAREEVLSQFSYDEYLNIMINYFTIDLHNRLNQWSGTLEPEFETTRNHICNNLLTMISNMAYGFDKLNIESNPIIDNLGTYISWNVESHIFKSARDMIRLAYIAHTEFKWPEEKYPKFYKVDDQALFEFINDAEFEDLPYNVEALHMAINRTLNFMGSMTIPNFNCITHDMEMWSKLYELLGEVDREITERIINSPDIEYIDDTKDTTEKE